MQDENGPEPEAPDAVPPEGESGGEEAQEAGFADYEADGYTTSDFHTVIQKQVLNATYETLADAKFHWGLIEPFLHAAREVCRGDFRRTGRVQVHGVAAEGEGWAEAEEAYLSLSVADQDDGREWLSETWWLSDLVLAEGDPSRVREAARALERSVAKLDAWLAAHEKGPGESG